MARLPKLWSAADGTDDNNNWGTVLNEFLRVAHNEDGTAKSTGFGWINVKDSPYGATGNGSTDDTAAFNAAEAVARSTNQKLFIPAGIYAVDGWASLGGLHIVGAGRPYTRIKYTGVGGSALAIQAAGYQHTHISDLTFENAGSGTTVGLDVTYTFVYVTRCTFGSFDAGTTGFTHGVRFNSISGGRTFENTIRDSYFNGNTTTGVRLVLTDYTRIKDCRFDNNLTSVAIVVGIGNQIVGGSMQGDFSINGANWRGIDLDDAQSTSIRDVAFELDRTGLAGASGANAVRLGGGTGVAIGTIVEGCWLNGVGVVGTEGIKVVDAALNQKLTVRDNRYHRLTTGIAVPTGGRAELKLEGFNHITSTTQLGTTNGVAWDANEYAGYSGSTGPFDLNGPLGLPSYTVAGVPSAAIAGRMIYVSNEAGGAVPAFSDGTSWRRVTDRVVVS